MKLGRVPRRLYGNAMLGAPYEERRKELEEAFRDSEVKCVMAARPKTNSRMPSTIMDDSWGA